MSKQGIKPNTRLYKRLRAACKYHDMLMPMLLDQKAYLDTHAHHIPSSATTAGFNEKRKGWKN